MKTLKIIYIVLITFVINSCSEESVIEGLVPSKPIVVELNQEILSGTFGTTTILIDNDEYKLKTSYYRPNAIGEHQVYFDLLDNNQRYIRLARKVNLVLVNQNDVIDQNLFIGPAYNSEILLWGFQSSFQAGGQFNYYSQNGSSFDKLLYVPFTTGSVAADVKNKNIYGWLSVIVTKARITLIKVAYVKNTSINAGQEE